MNNSPKNKSKIQQNLNTVEFFDFMINISAIRAIIRIVIWYIDEHYCVLM